MASDLSFGNFVRENDPHPVINSITEKKRQENEQQQQMVAQQEGQMMQGGDNPFALQQYKDMVGADTPIKFGGGMAESMISNDDVPPNFLEKYWFVFNKDNVLTFLDEKRKNSKLLNLDIIKIDHLNMMPYFDYDFETELDWNVIRNVFETKLDRALGFKGGNIKNERITLQSQFTEQRQISEAGNGMMKEGFFKRLLGRR